MKAIVLNSGGVDSTTCVGIAVDRYGKENVTTVSAYYGQKNDKELSCAEKIAEHYGVTHRVIDLASTHIMDGSDCTLLQGGKDIAHGTYAEQMAEGDSKIATYVPFRNGFCLQQWLPWRSLSIRMRSASSIKEPTSMMRQEMPIPTAL